MIESLINILTFVTSFLIGHLIGIGILMITTNIGAIAISKKTALRMINADIILVIIILVIINFFIH